MLTPCAVASSRISGQILCASLALSLLAATGLHAQDAASPPKKPTETQQASAQSIPLAQVGVEAQNVSEVIDHLKALAAPDPKLDTISVGLGVIGDSLASMRAQPDFQNLEKLSSRALTDLNSPLQRYRAQIKEWEDQLLEKSGEIAEAIKQLDRLKEIWSATRDTARVVRAPRSLRRQIETTFSTLDEGRAVLGRQFNRLLSLQEAVTSQSLPINEDGKRIEARRQEIEREIFVVDAPPLWQALAAAEDTTDLATAASETWSATVGSTVRYLEVNVDRVVIHLSLTFMCFVLFLLLRRQVGAMAAGEQLPEPLPDAVRLLRRPLLAALLVLMFLVRYVYQDAPVGLYDFFRIVVVVPFILLAMVWFKSEMRAIALAIGFLYLVNLTQELVAEGPGSGRLLLLAESIGGVVVIAFGLRPGGILRSPGAVPRQRLVVRLAIVALVLLVVAMGANLIGSVSLARRLTSGIITSAATAIFFGILVLLADGVFFFAVKAWVTKISRLTYRFAEYIIRVGARLFAAVGMVLWVLSVLTAFRPPEDRSRVARRGTRGEVGVRDHPGLAGRSASLCCCFAGAFLAGAHSPPLPGGGALQPGEIPARCGRCHCDGGALFRGGTWYCACDGGARARSGKFGLLAGALGVGLGFGLQHVVANFVSGIILAFERPIQVGDMVQMGSLWGTISSIGVRSTRVRSFDGSEVVIPNNDLISKEVTNWTLSDNLRRMAFPVKVEFGSEPRQVIDVMLEAVRQHEVPRTDPAPFVIFEGLGEYFLNFTLYFWITTDKYMVGKNDVGMAVLDALKRAGIQIPSAPHRITIDDRRSSGNAPRLIGG